MSVNLLYENAKAMGLVDGVPKIDRSGFQNLIVAPLGTSVPEDGFLSYVTINTFRDILSAANMSVVLFREDQADLLVLLCGNGDTLGCSVQAMYGVPTASYDRWFDEATFSVPRLSYSPTISEIRESQMVSEIRETNRPKTVIEKEVARRTRADGSVRYHDDDSIGVVESGDD